ncbi:cation:proton antiporter [Candidatus Woesearchaeota archaeon]|nr:cation:proton antiporter [Candidatus Woesearchaeota archaeon]
MVEAVISRIEFQMTLLLFVALAGYLLASKINQSAVIGEILVGLLIGPSVLGLVTYSEFIENIAHLGAIILLFVIGLEFKLSDVFKPRYGLIAIVGVIVPWLGGFLIAKVFGFGFGSAAFVGTALTATSIAITANVLREMNQLHTEAAKAIIGAAVIDDVLSLLALSITSQTVSGQFSFLETFLVIFKSVMFIGVASFVGIKYINPIINRIDKSRFVSKFPEFVFIFAMMIAFLYALVAEIIQLSSIIGAFIAGMVLEGVVVRHGKDYREGAEYLHIIFASVFFVSLGILADLKAITWPILGFLLALVLVAVLTKLIGCYVPARLLGLGNRSSAIIGWGMSPRGEVAMIVAMIGLNGGLIKQDIFISIIMMSLVTTILAPVILRRILVEHR